MAKMIFCPTCEQPYDTKGKLPKDALPTLGLPREECPWCQNDKKIAEEYTAADPDGLNNIKIEKNIPVPQNAGRNKYGFLRKMKPGDSILLADDKKLMQRVAAAAYNYGKNHKQKFVCRKVKGGYRIWRFK